MSKRSYTLIGEDALDAQEQVAELVWPDRSPVRLGDFGHRLRIAGLLFQGEGENILIFGPNGAYCAHDFIVPTSVSLETWCKIIKQTDQPVYFERNEQGMIKAVHRKVRAQISTGTKWRIFERDGFQCMYCGKHGGNGVPLTIDHWVPISRNGPDHEKNYLTSCRRCAKVKGDRDPEKFCNSEGLDYFGLKQYLVGSASKSFISHL